MENQDIKPENLSRILTVDAEKTAQAVEAKNSELSLHATVKSTNAAKRAKHFENATQLAMDEMINSNLAVAGVLTSLEKSANETLLSAQSAAAIALIAEKNVKITKTAVDGLNLALVQHNRETNLTSLRAAATLATSAAFETVEKIAETVVATHKSILQATSLQKAVSKAVKASKNTQTASTQAGRAAADAAKSAVEESAAAAKIAADASKSAAKSAVELAAKMVVKSAELTQAAATAGSEKVAAELASESKSSFLANMSHEIRTPLSAIIGFADLITEEIGERGDPAMRGHADAIVRNSKHLAALIDDVLDISKIEAGALEVEKIPTRVREELDGVIETLTQKATQRGDSLKVNYGLDVPEFIDSDPMRIRQILINIIGNSIKFTEHGNIEINVDIVTDRSQGQKSYLRFQIIDSGSGIPLEKQSKLFESYGQADRSTARRFGGTGLGLMLSRKLARLMGGDVLLVQSSPGKGSKFEIRIAADTSTEAAHKDSGVSPSGPESIINRKPLEGCHILLAEDSPDLQIIFEHIVAANGGQVQIANDGEEAVRVATSGNFDIVVMDVEMPIIDGNEANKRLRQQGYKVPIIAFTAHALLSKKHFNNAAYEDYISKPITPVKLVEVLKKWYPQKNNSHIARSL